MNIVWAVKLAAGLLACAGLAYLLLGPGLRRVMTPTDWRVGCQAVAGTAVISCMSFTPTIFCIILAAWSLWLAKRIEADGMSALYAYALLLVSCPPISVLMEIPGASIYLLQLTPTRILSITLLLPLVIRQWSTPGKTAQPGWLRLCDLSVLLYAALMLNKLNDYAFTAVARLLTESLLDNLLPYFALTRAAVDSTVRKRMLSFLLFGASFQAVVGTVEGLTHHQFYSPLQYLYHVSWQTMLAQERGGLLRAQAAFVGALPLAVLMLFAMGVWATLRPTARSAPYNLVGLALISGLVFTFGRAAWLCAALMVLSLVVLRYLNGRQYVLLSLALATVLGVAWAQGLGDTITQGFIQGFGSTGTEAFNIRYRKELLDTALALLKQRPWWGVGDFLQYMEHMRQGEGIIDLVNTYLVVALNVGAVGLTFFLIPFAVTLWLGALQHSKRAPVLGVEAPVWLALTVAVMAMVFTVSPISIIQPLLIWTVALPLARLQEPALASR